MPSFLTSLDYKYNNDPQKYMNMFTARQSGKGMKKGLHHQSTFLLHLFGVIYFIIINFFVKDALCSDKMQCHRYIAY